MIHLPSWLRTDPYAIYLPDRTIFEPQPRARRINGQAHLLDCNEQLYPLRDCDRLRPEYLQGVALLITASAPLTVSGCPGGLVVSDGTKTVKILYPQQDELRAVESLARAFSGAIKTEKIGA